MVNLYRWVVERLGLGPMTAWLSTFRILEYPGEMGL